MSKDIKFVEGNYPFKTIEIRNPPQNEDERTRMDVSIEEDPYGNNLSESHPEPTCDQPGNEPTQNLTDDRVLNEPSSMPSETIDET